MSSSKKDIKKEKINKNKGFFISSKENLKKFWNFIWYDDSLLSYLLNFLVAYIFIKFILFPGFGFILNNDYPIVAIVSGSMEHKIVDHRICDKYILDISRTSISQEEWWEFCGSYYEKNYNLTLDDFREFDYRNGLNIGDVMVLYGKDVENIQIGEILVFVPQDRNFFETKGPVIHRVVKKWKDDEGKYHFQTKGDHNDRSFKNFENDITEDNVIGVSILRVPYIGYVKLAGYRIFENLRSLI